MLALVVVFPAFCQCQETQLKIGVLAKRGTEMSLKKWTPTAEYLTEHIPNYSFTIVPLDFKQIYSAVEKAEVDFVICNPYIYVEFEEYYGVVRIATLKNMCLEKSYTEFGGIIFCGSDNPDIRSLNDLKGKTFMGVAENSFGGFVMSLREMEESGVDPFSDFAEITFGGTHDEVVYAVRDGRVDAGTVRTDTLERMETEGKIQLKDFYVIHEHGGGNVYLPLLHSTRSYPEWPFAKLKHTPNKISEEVAIQLLRMSPNSPAATAAMCAGWSVPLNYQPVHECLKELRIGHYRDLGKITPADVFRKYWHWFLATLVLFIIMVRIIIFILKLNRRIKTSQVKLQSGIDERRHKEEELRKTRDYLDNLIESSLDCIVVSDSAGYITRVNRAFLKLLDYEKEEVIGEMLTKFSPSKEGIYESTTEIFVEIDEKFLNETSTAVSRFLRDGKMSNWETFLICKNKKVIPIGINIALLYNKEGNRVGAVGILRDITERKRAEEALRKSEAKYRELVQNANSIILRMDLKGYISFFNEFAQKFFGYSEDEIISRNVVGTIVPEIDSSGRDLAAMIEDIGRNPGRYQSNENENIRRNGERVWVAWTNRAIHDKDGNITELLCIGNDITKRKQSEKKLVDYQNQLKSLASQLTLAEEQERRRFAAYLHDRIGQALFILKIKLGMIKEQYSSTDITKSLEEILNIVEQTIKDTRSLTFELSPPILYQLGFEAALEWLVEQMYEQYGILAIFEDDKKPKPLNEDVLVLLFQAVRELLINVTKHARTQNVKVSTRRDDNHIQVSVEDEGVGFVVSKSGSSDYNSKGFGLFSIEERLDHLGGHLEIESGPERGTRVALFAPLKK